MRLSHNDRLIIGNNHVFRVVDAFATPGSEEGAPVYDWRFAIEEMHKKKMAALNAQEQRRREEVRDTQIEHSSELQRNVTDQTRHLRTPRLKRKKLQWQKKSRN